MLITVKLFQIMTWYFLGVLHRSAKTQKLISKYMKI